MSSWETKPKDEKDQNATNPNFQSSEFSSWSDEEFEPPIIASVTGIEAETIQKGENLKTVEDEDWHKPSKVQDGSTVSAKLLKNTSTQAVFSLNTPACRKKRRCIICTRPIGNDPTVSKCERCV
mmetsp:Transcript_17264/g.20338  ORF Transcript_17264/g.20338 Transcript_17264/m.20338 type:complete len:124 (-) Transcript_17264:233-604(-)